MNANEPIRLLLIQCGQTDWDQQGRLCGRADLPLSTTGRRLVTEQARGFINNAPELILCGPDEGSMQTAEIYANVCCAQAPKALPELSEIALGLWEGLLLPQLQERCPRTYKQWMANPSTVIPPEGEAVVNAQSRVVDGVLQALRRAGSLRRDARAMLVLKPITLGLVRCWAQGLSLEHLWDEVEAGRTPGYITLKNASSPSLRGASLAASLMGVGTAGLSMLGLGPRI